MDEKRTDRDFPPKALVPWNVCGVGGGGIMGEKGEKKDRERRPKELPKKSE